ncbi:MAG: [FeFe] hydrogenase H-cluster maturation GTPase HydF [Lentimicrobiaceae bacterium]|nr:[FeFe] hydrogenase H-cluster maturation GTPase HydF [Lentimicrobiaceae bacterium]
MSRGKDNKPHIGIFGRRNSGKSSLINALAGQELAIVSATPGTTTDPVRKSMEITGIGPVIMIDTAGIDDEGELGQKRVARSRETLKTIDLALLLFSGNVFGVEEEMLINDFRKYEIPFILIHNKSDLQPLDETLGASIAKSTGAPLIDLSARFNAQPQKLTALLQQHMPETAYTAPGLMEGLIVKDDVVLLITPIDNEAPQGRLILPQVQVIRSTLDNNGIALVCKESEAESYIRRMKPEPTLVVTDSQVFAKADAIVPGHIPLTSFSILLARQRGDFKNYVKGTPYIDQLKEGDRILILESCTHQVSCDDIGRVKIPAWLRKYTGRKLHFETVAGLTSLPRDIHEYAMVIQCGGCVITRRQIINRLKPAVEAGIPVTNYGMAIAWIHGIYQRAMAPFNAAAPL